MRSSSRLAAVALVAAHAACSANPAPRGYLPTALEAASSTRGGWIRVEGGGKRWAGELLAASADGVDVLTPAGVVTVPAGDIDKATVWTHRGAPLAGIGTAGLLSTLTHGYLLVFSVPVWAVTLGVAGSAEGKATRLDYPRTPLAELRGFARFPQGRPEGLDLSTLVPVPSGAK